MTSTARTAIAAKLASAESALGGAKSAYAEAQERADEAKAASTRAYDGYIRNYENVQRLKKTLATYDGEAGSITLQFHPSPGVTDIAQMIRGVNQVAAGRRA